MSASTVSITANPASTRRRAVVVTGQKSTTAIEIVPVENGGIGGHTGEDKGKDLSQSIRGDAKDLASVKKTQANSTVSPRRTRKSPLKPEKPWWMTAVSIFTKNFVLLIVVLGLVQLIRRLSVQPSGTNPVALTDFEGRIAEVEGLLKKTSKMIQVQVDVVDKKVESEIGTLREEISKTIEEKTAILETEFKKLEAKSENMESYLSELKGKDWLSKQDFDSFIEDLKKAKGGADGESILSLDDIKAYAREVVLKEIEKHAADGLGRVDYALASGGAVVYKHSEPFVVGKGSNWFSLTNRQGVRSDATRMLTPSFGEPGQCFPLKGSSGFVQIRLRKAIIPEAVTLEHVAKSVAYDRSSAPKDCRISGWLQGDSNAATEPERIFLLSEFTYDLEKSNAQTFNVLDSTTGIIDTVRFDFTSNHGSPTHTCIYRLRVHGQEPASDSLLAMES